ncbi:hypothetical protein AVEN_212237-1 [Araneus ventricosus]|uniref:Uncharacterized protein n=1 Tax=Araneus ventricosus TaxID=182803 RepID=A0A4Y2ELU8_ARAVE|nr:hypothetical protein AVEN_212237-1 [Araneus ventricosus]
MKLWQVCSAVFITGVLFSAVHSSPSVSRLSDGNGRHGYEYEVSHPAGSSRVHVNAGQSSNKQQYPHHLDTNYRNNRVRGYNYHPQHSYGPPRKSYYPEGYKKRPINYESSPYDSEEIYEPQPYYASPYDSTEKKIPIYRSEIGYSEPQISKINHPSYNAPVGQEHIDLQIGQEYVDPPISQDYVDSPYPPESDLLVAKEYPTILQEHIETPIVQEYVNPPVIKEYINPPIGQEYVEHPVVQEPIKPLITQELFTGDVKGYPPALHDRCRGPIARVINPPVVKGYPPATKTVVSGPVVQEHINPPAVKGYPPATKTVVSAPVVQEHINPPAVKGYPPSTKTVINAPVVQEHINPPTVKGYPSSIKTVVSAPVVQEHINPLAVKGYPPSPKTVVSTPIVQKHINPPVAKGYANSPISQDYIDSPYSNEHISPSSEILSAHVSEPAFDASKSGSGPPGPKYVLIPDGPPHIVDTHSTEIIHPPLPNNQGSAIPPPSPFVSHGPGPNPSHALPLPHTSNHAPYPPISSDAPGPVSPISHSTRLLVPEQGFPKYPETASSLSSPEANLHASSGLPPPSHAIRLGIPPITTSPGEHSPRLSQPQPLIGGPVPPPASHAFRLNLPSHPAPVGTNNHPFDSGVSSLSEENLHSPRASHAVRLSWPSASGEKQLSIPKVEYFPGPGIQGSSDTDTPLLALESKSE